MAINNTTYRSFVEKLGNTDPSQFVGEEGDLFWDPNTGELKLSDGETSGGIDVSGGGGNNGVSQSYVDNKVGVATAGLASEEYVDNKVGVSTVGLASEEYVDNKVGLSTAGLTAGLASETYVDTQVGLATAGLASETYVDTQVGVSTAGLASEAYVNQQIAAPISQSLIPDTDNAYDLGSPTYQWRELHVTSNTMYVGGIPIGMDEDGRLTVNKEPLAKKAELNGDRIEELQDAMITAQAAYNGQLEALTNKLASIPKTVHASWDASAGESFDWSTDEIASSGVSNVTRQDSGIYRVTFSEDFSSTKYTVTTGVGSKDYKSKLAIESSPRGVSVLLESRTTSSVDIICERTDDAVNEDNAYMSVIIMGT